MGCLPDLPGRALLCVTQRCSALLAWPCCALERHGALPRGRNSLKQRPQQRCQPPHVNPRGFISFLFLLLPLALQVPALLRFFHAKRAEMAQFLTSLQYYLLFEVRGGRVGVEHASPPGEEGGSRALPALQREFALCGNLHPHPTCIPVHHRMSLPMH